MPTAISWKATSLWLKVIFELDGMVVALAARLLRAIVPLWLRRSYLILLWSVQAVWALLRGRESG